MGGRFEAFIPPRIATLDFELDKQAAYALSDGEQGLGALRREGGLHGGLSSLAETLLRSESVASSRIEGVNVSHARLARVRFGDGPEDKKAREVLANVDAMRKAIELGASSVSLDLEAIKDVHRALIRDEELRGEPYAGVVRQEQNWIGGNAYNPVGASFVPPPHDEVEPLLADLAEFMARDDLPALAQAAIAHAQFETIHPFLDGNGRTGRALVYAILRRRGELNEYVPPISLVLGGVPQGYVGSLKAYQGQVSSARHPAALIAETFGQATMVACREAINLRQEVEALQAGWREKLTGLRSDASAWKLVEELPGRPVVTATSLSEALGISFPVANNAILELESREILRPLNQKRWGRGWEAPELLKLVERFEKRVSRRPAVVGTPQPQAAAPSAGAGAGAGAASEPPAAIPATAYRPSTAGRPGDLGR
jgi:Fic family protein